ncbi:DUF2550 domain-containing protein [Catellatospora bangladeshensis]|uniref:DUF2550 family protein n=1 Tax=Catellatospora bangladeshensis TaxID=310355 RepID=A0A8J3NFV7_9ACTN|nr:DUF2550 domain-containing protein [Catellatospora bangladeshensis]GIF79737.1 hypothetical protein Cba03nite_10860 [Catellatospora bangladeshensis]
MRSLLEAIAIGLVVLLALLAGLFVRRELFARGHGTVELYLRLRQAAGGRGWAPGFAQFRGDELRWYRMFSLSPRPRRRYDRRELKVLSRRAPTADEAVLVPADWIVLHCADSRTEVEIAMPMHTVTGFLSWLEAAAPYSM